MVIFLYRGPSVLRSASGKNTDVCKRRATGDFLFQVWCPSCAWHNCIVSLISAFINCGCQCHVLNSRSLGYGKVI